MSPFGPERRVRALRHRLATQRATLHAHDESVVRLQVRLARLPAPTGHEARRAARVARWFRRLGMRDVRTDEAGNVLAVRAGAESSRPVVVCAHLDTVFPDGVDCTVRREGARLLGAGISDNGRGLAVMLALAGVTADPLLRFRHPIVFAATTGEEGAGDLRGVKHLFSSLPEEPVAAIALDGPGDDRVVHQAVGSRRFHVAFAGPGGHSWASAGAANPVHAAGRVTRQLAGWRPTTPRTTLAVTRIGGGMSVNAIPESAWLEVDVRSVSFAGLDEGERAVRTAVANALAEENAARARWSVPCSAHVACIGDRPAGVVDAAAPLVRHALAATRAIRREPVASAASTDANVPIALGIPAIAIGGGGTGGGMHTTEEWYENTEGALGMERALLILAAAAGLR